MSGFDSLQGAIDPGVAAAPLVAGQVKPAGEGWSDDTALNIVLSDTSDSISYLQSKGLVPVGIEAADQLVRGFVPPKQWPDGKPRANLSMHVVLQMIEKILPALYMTLFGSGKKTPFLVERVGQTKPEAARANASLLSWAMKQSNTKEEMRLMMKTALTYGFCVGSWGWECKTKRKKVYKKDPDNVNGKMKSEWKEEDIELPSFESLDLKTVLVDPGLKRQDIQAGAKFVVKQIMTDGYGLADYRDNDCYKNIPTDDELIQILTAQTEPTEDSLGVNKSPTWREFQAQLPTDSTLKDPLMQPLEILEYTSADRVVAVLQRRIVIRNEENEFAKLNFQSCAFIDVLGSAWGFGIAKLNAGEQRLQTGVMNNSIDAMALIMNPVFQMLKGNGPGTQSIPISPGKVITETGEMKPLVVPNDSVKIASAVIAESDQRAAEKVGANGGSGLPNPAMRTAEGVQAFNNDIIQRMAYWLEIFINLVYIPTLEAFLMIMKDHLTQDQVNSILTEMEGKAYEGDITDVYGAEVNVDVIAGANMMAKFTAAQLAPQLIALVSAGPVSEQMEVTALKFNYPEFITEYTDMMGWDVENLIIPMTDEDKQRVQQKNAALQRVQGDLMLQNAKHQDTLSEIDAKGSTQADVATVRSILKGHEASANAAMEQMQTPQQGNGQ